jgi:hypothetical protein
MPDRGGQFAIIAVPPSGVSLTSERIVAACNLAGG